MALAQRCPSQTKRAKSYSSRAISTENIERGFRNGSLSVPEFIDAREFEIKSFEQSQLKSKAASSTRVFQNLPRSLRRRTASHNVKRVPKRLRSKALREMQNTIDGTPGKKQCLRGRELYRFKTQKRLLRVASKIKVLRCVPQTSNTKIKDRIKILNKQLAQSKSRKTSTLKNSVAAFDRSSVNSLSPRPTGYTKYGARQRQFTWTPTHIWHAKRYHMTKKWGFQIPLSPNQKCFRSTSRAAKEATIAFESSYYSELVAECQNCENTTKFLNSFTRYCDIIPAWLIKGEKVYDGWIYLEDQKFAPGAVLVDPTKHKIMVRLHPSIYEQFFDAIVTWVNGKYPVFDCRFAIGGIELRGPTSLAALSKILHLDANKEVTKNWHAYSQSKDPKLIPAGTMFSFFVRDPRLWRHPVKAPPVSKKLSEAVLTKASATDNNAVSSIFCSTARTKSYENMYSMKQLGKVFSRSDSLPSHIDAVSRFPVIIFKTLQESWCILMPWFWAQPMWSKLIKVKFVQTAGMRQIHQVNFENNVPTYPQDYPFLPECYKEHLLATESAKQVRANFPPSKQPPKNSPETVYYCDTNWYFLWKWKFGMHFVKEKDGKKSSSFRNIDEIHNQEFTPPDKLATMINSMKYHYGGLVPITAYDKTNPDHLNFVRVGLPPIASRLLPLPVVQASLTLIDKGCIRDNARIYERVPHPTFVHLIGFVTSGDFNNKTGHPAGIGLVSADRQMEGDVLVQNARCTTFHKVKLTVWK